MSLLINGMDMPCMCCLCPCHDWDMETNRYYCQALKDEPKIIDENTRCDDCPLVEIPTPHGKLIDADAAIARLKHLYCDGCGCDCSTCQWGAFIKYIDGRPTIIEAEEHHISDVSKETLVMSYQDDCDGYYDEDY